MLGKVKAGPDEQWFNFKIKQFHYGEDDDRLPHRHGVVAEL